MDKWINTWVCIFAIMLVILLAWWLQEVKWRRDMRKWFPDEPLTHFTRDGKEYVIPTRIVEDRRNRMAQQHASDGPHDCAPWCPGWPDVKRRRPYDHVKDGL